MNGHDVEVLYERFFKLGGPPAGSQRPWQYRRRETSLRLDGCQLMVDIVNERKPKLILDLGSGITSHLLRHAALPDGIVVTTDTDERWLKTTIRELQRDGWKTERCVTQTEFESQTHSRFDLISVDCGNLTYRASLAPKLAEWCAPEGILVLDDWHMEPYPQIMGDALRALGFEIQVFDEVATAERAA